MSGTHAEMSDLQKDQSPACDSPTPLQHSDAHGEGYPGQKRDSIAFGTLAIVAQLAFLALFSGCMKYSDEARPMVAGDFEAQTHAGAQSDLHIYTYFSDVHVMIFIGFGFLMTFMGKYGYGAVGLNFFLSALVAQWAMLNNSFWNAVRRDPNWGRQPITMETAVEGDFAAASVMITFGAIIGKTTPLQLLIIALIEVMCYSVNKVILEQYLYASDIGGTMVIHMFGAYFGLACSRVLHSKNKDGLKTEDSAPNYHSDLFSMIGTVFLWIYWPSFNAALARSGSMQDRAVINTLISLCACCVTAVAVSALVRHSNKLEMIDVQNATLAGGVAIGSSANLGIYPQGAMAVGICAGIISVVGYRYIQPFLENKCGLHDTCGVNNLHGMPSIFGACVTAAVAGAARSAVYGEQMLNVWVGRDHAVNTKTWHGDERNRFMQGGYQMAAACMTFGIAIFTGTVVGFLVRPLNRRIRHFHDEMHWVVAQA